MKILLLTILLQIGLPQYKFKNTSGYIQGQSGIPKTESNINYQARQNNSPRKVSGFDGWTFWILWGSSHGVPSSASNEDLYSYYDYIQNGGTMNYNDWYNYKHNPVPIGEPYILLLIACVYAYRKTKFTTKYCKNTSF